MEFTDQEKMKIIKRILIARIQMVDSLEALKSLIGDTVWGKLINLLDVDLQAEADQCDTDSQESLDKKAKLLALKEEKDTY